MRLFSLPYVTFTFILLIMTHHSIPFSPTDSCSLPSIHSYYKCIATIQSYVVILIFAWKNFNPIRQTILFYPPFSPTRPLVENIRKVVVFIKSEKLSYILAKVVRSNFMYVSDLRVNVKPKINKNAIGSLFNTCFYQCNSCFFVYQMFKRCSFL